MEEKKVLVEEKEVKEIKEMNNEVTTTKHDMIVGFNENKRSKSDVYISTTLDIENDKKKIFNLQNKIDYKLNDIVGQKIRLQDVFIKVIITKLDNPVVDENGEILREYETTKLCYLIDDEGKVGVTKSKMFTNQIVQYIDMFGEDSIKGLEIMITTKPVKDSQFKALAFELI